VIVRRGLGAEVPHWYCYIPFFPSADCWRAFGQGTAELIGATVGSAVSGVTDVITGRTGRKKEENTSEAPDPTPPYGVYLLLAGAGIYALSLFSGKRRR
jgi:hypothetical protein